MGEAALYRRFLAQARPYWPHLGALFLLGLLSSLLALLAPLPLKIAVDSVIGAHPLPRHLAPLVPDAITRSPGGLLAFATGLLLAVALLGQLQGLASASLRAWLKHDVPATRHILTESLIPFMTSAVTLIGMLYVAARIDWLLASVTLAIAAGLVVTGPPLPRRLRRRSREVHKLTTAAGTAAVLLMGVHHVRSGQITLGDLLLVLGYITQLREPLRTIRRKEARLPLQGAGAERAFPVPEELSDAEERTHAGPLARARGGIAFRRVSFGYGDERPTLHDLSFEIEPGTRLGIAGASGAGKSALLNLLMRFCDPTEGQIRLDGVDLRHIRPEDLRRQFAVVPEDPVLFSASIAENIARARPRASQGELVAAAQAANAHEFIVRLPDGYDTLVGERGVQLSGGQRQRIAIAQAFLKDSPVLVLDEPTSAVDEESEAAVVEAIRRLMRGRTVLLLTHRQSLLERCRALVVLENGRLVSDTTCAAPMVVPIAGAAAVRRGQATLMSHPAVHAWRQLYPGSEPHRITPLRVSLRKTMVYRLQGAGPDGSIVIAKRSRKKDALIERTVYEDILPRLTIPSLRYYGFFEDADAEHCWLFLEDVAGAEYSGLLAEDRARAARWLGLLHTSAAEVAAKTRLPDGGPGRYRKLLWSAHESIREHLDNPVLGPDDVRVLEEVLARLTELDAQWHRLEELCDGLRPTLVHGDFNGKNLRLRTASAGTTVLVFDWEDAGWGVPAVDLAQQAVPSSYLSANPDIPTYWSTVRESWPNMTTEALQKLAYCGTVFRALAALYWESFSLGTEWASRFMTDIRLYDAEMVQALARLGWNGRSASAPVAGGVMAEQHS
jgi:ABC-type multidrug transport system fused ATPase/permease subunit